MFRSFTISGIKASSQRYLEEQKAMSIQDGDKEFSIQGGVNRFLIMWISCDG